MPGEGMKRYMAHEIVANGVNRPMAIISIDEHDGSYTIAPFSGEVHSTVFVNGTLVIGERPAGNCRLLHPAPPLWHLPDETS